MKISDQAFASKVTPSSSSSAAAVPPKSNSTSPSSKMSPLKPIKEEPPDANMASASSQPVKLDNATTKVSASAQKKRKITDTRIPTPAQYFIFKILNFS